VLNEPILAQLVRPTRAGGELSYGSVPADPFEVVAHGHMATLWSPNEAL